MPLASGYQKRTGKRTDFTLKIAIFYRSWGGGPIPDKNPEPLNPYFASYTGVVGAKIRFSNHPFLAAPSATPRKRRQGGKKEEGVRGGLHDRESAGIDHELGGEPVDELSRAERLPRWRVQNALDLHRI